MLSSSAPLVRRWLRSTRDTEDRGIDWIDLAADQCTLFYTSEGA
jgi:hypothetical protein